MSTTAVALTVEEFLQLPEYRDERVELIGGEVVAIPNAGYAHEVVKANFSEVFHNWRAHNPTFKVFSETSFRLDEHNAPTPDVSLLLKKRLAPGTTGLIKGAPELAVEVVSSESASNLEKKIRLYLSHGSKYVLVAYTEHRSIRVYDASGHSRPLDENQVLDGLDDLLPGFRVPVARIFEGV